MPPFENAYASPTYIIVKMRCVVNKRIAQIGENAEKVIARLGYWICSSGKLSRTRMPISPASGAAKSLMVVLSNAGQSLSSGFSRGQVCSFLFIALPPEYRIPIIANINGGK